MSGSAAGAATGGGAAEPLTGEGLRLLVTAALQRWSEAGEELRELDAAVGDGDLGITVRAGCEAVSARLDGLADPTPSAVVKAAGAAFATANPSTMAALVGGALLAGAKSLGDKDRIGGPEAAELLRAAIESITTRGKSAVGDKTILDAMVPSLEALESAGPDAAPISEMIAAAQKGVDETAGLQSRRGRASWVGERAVGHPDPGATAYVRFLQAVASAMEDADRGA